jgi:leukotriene-A4 hydrolase
LDCKNVEIKSVKHNNKDLKWAIYDEMISSKALGTPLIVLFDDDTLTKKGNKLILSIEFSTTNLSDAVQWLLPEQTLMKKYPFIFTQCEAILARTLIPCQV